MSFYSKQKIFCNACGIEMFQEIPAVYGKNFKVCSAECNLEMNWRYTLSIMNQEYRDRNK